MDTIVYRLHNLDEHYPQLRDFLITLLDSEGKMDILAKDAARTMLDNRAKLLRLAADGSVDVVNGWSNLHIPSSFYDVAFCPKFKRNYVDFNVSIPKFYLGTNVPDFIIPPGHKNYSPSQVSPFAHVDFWYSMIIRCWHDIINILAKPLLLEVKLSDVEIRRLDIAIAQTFATAEEAEGYQKYQRTIARKNAKGENRHDYTSTLMDVVEGFSFKIYQKGAEFAKQWKTINDSADAVLRKNKKALHHPMVITRDSLDDIQALANRQLRYEVSLHQGKLNDIFNRKLLFRGSKMFKKMKAIHKVLTNEKEEYIINAKIGWKHLTGKIEDKKPMSWAMQYRECYYVDIYDGKEMIRTELTERQSKMINCLNRWGIVSLENKKQWIAWMGKVLGMTRKLMLDIPGHLPDLELSTITDPRNAVRPEVKFSSTLIAEAVSVLETEFNNRQVYTKKSFSELADKIKLNNELYRAKISNPATTEAEKKKLKAKIIGPIMQRSLMQYDALIEQNNRSQDKTLIEQGIFGTKSSFYRMKQRFYELQGQKAQFAHAWFGNVERRFNNILADTHRELLNGSKIHVLYKCLSDKLMFAGNEFGKY